MARAATSFPDAWESPLATRIAALRRPSLSYHINVLLEDDLRSAGLLKTSERELEWKQKVEQLIAGLDEKARDKFLADLDDLVRASRRSRRTAA